MRRTENRLLALAGVGLRACSTSAGRTTWPEVARRGVAAVKSTVWAAPAPSTALQTDASGRSCCPTASFVSTSRRTMTARVCGTYAKAGCVSDSANNRVLKLAAGSSARPGCLHQPQPPLMWRWTPPDTVLVTDSGEPGAENQSPPTTQTSSSPTALAPGAPSATPTKSSTTTFRAPPQVTTMLPAPPTPAKRVAKLPIQ